MHTKEIKDNNNRSFCFIRFQVCFKACIIKPEKGNIPTKTNKKVSRKIPPCPPISPLKRSILCFKKKPLVHSPSVLICTKTYQGTENANTSKIPHQGRNSRIVFQLKLLFRIKNANMISPGKSNPTGPFANIAKPNRTYIRAHHFHFPVVHPLTKQYKARVSLKIR